MTEPPVFAQLNVVAKDLAASVAFYRRLGLGVESQPGDQHVEVALRQNLSMEWDSIESVRHWDSGWAASGDGLILGFTLASHAAVDEKYHELLAAGYAGHQPPYDAFWGARYAIIEDPDGNRVGLMSPTEVDRKYWPPVAPPTA